MEKFIEELERERVEELDAYLAVTGLRDYKLTEKEKDALAKFDEFGRRGGERVNLLPWKHYSTTLNKAEG